MGLADRLVAKSLGPVLRSRRLLLRPLVPSDFFAYQEVRRRCENWLVKWEPRRPSGAPDVAENRRAFDARCEAADRERAAGSAYRFGIFLPEESGAVRFAGEVNLGTVQRGAFQNAYVGYWIDEAVAGKGLMPEAVLATIRFGFEELGLHRIQISIIPRNNASRRVVEKLQIRNEGVAERYLEINGTWEDHVRYGITVEEWRARGAELARLYL
jgi:[ribosomal protein S5]-alanine N-acetyltransferase